MRYDLDLIHQLCKEVGLRSASSAPDGMAIELAEDVRLTFQNAGKDDDCLVGFNGTPWHTHGDFTFVDGRGNYVETDYLDVITGLVDGRILVCELSRLGVVADRWLIHRDYNDEFKHMEFGEKIAVWRPATSK
jgi:hypothetical protein